MRRAAIVGCLLLAACSSTGSARTTHDLQGAITLSASNTVPGPPCYGLGGYADMAAGTPIVVKIQDRIVATGSLGAGVPIDKLAYQCALPIYVVGIPDGDFYSIEISHRGVQTYSKAQMEAMHWHLDLTLGNGS